MPEQNAQNAAFVFAERHGLSLKFHRALSGIVQKPLVTEQRGSRLPEIVGAPQKSLHLGQQHGEVEGLLDEIIRARAERHENVHIFRR